ncbi:MAG: hypothetical protein OXM03_11545, partial [Chloroflexota bacterium]|nr:hypothetical protein [Chloroflexota bacterium]
MKRDLNLIFIPLWLVCDALAIGLAVVTSYYVRFSLGWPPPEETHGFAMYYRLWFLLTVVYTVTMMINGLYRPQRHVPAEELLLKILASVALGTVVTVGVATFFWREGFDYSRLLVGYAAILSVFLLTFERIILSLARGVLHQKKMGTV